MFSGLLLSILLMKLCILEGELFLILLSISKLFVQDLILLISLFWNSWKVTGVFFFQKPSGSDLKSGRPDEVLSPAPERKVNLLFFCSIFFNSVKSCFNVQI